MEVKDFIEANHRNPSRHFMENRNLLSWMKHQRKLMNKGELKPERVGPFKELVYRLCVIFGCCYPVVIHGRMKRRPFVAICKLSFLCFLFIV